MPILSHKPNPKPVEKPVRKETIPVINDPPYRGNTVDTRFLNNNQLLSHVEGSSWIVNYFSQVLGKDSEPSFLQIGKDAVYQQYVQIRNLELKVSSPLSHNQDQETNESEVTGTAIIYPPLIPNKGDVFLADVGDGNEGIFSIISSQRLSVLTQSCYQIDYVLISYSIEPYLNDLGKKTVKHVNYVRDLLKFNRDPLLVDKEYNDYLSIDEHYTHLLNGYLTTFFNKTIGSLAVPNQVDLTYDPFVVNALKMFTDHKDHKILRVMKVYSIQLPNSHPPTTLWDALLQLSMETLPLCNERLALIDSYCFGTVPHYQNVYFSNICRVVYPVDKDNRNVLRMAFKEGEFGASHIRHHFPKHYTDDLLELNRPKGKGIEALVPIYSINKDEYYILSKNFYEGVQKEQSQLERLVSHALERKPLPMETVLKLIKSSDRWPKLERFYYIPILLIFLKILRHGY